MWTGFRKLKVIFQSIHIYSSIYSKFIHFLLTPIKYIAKAIYKAENLLFQSHFVKKLSRFSVGKTNKQPNKTTTRTTKYTRVFFSIAVLT